MKRTKIIHFIFGTLAVMTFAFVSCSGNSASNETFTARGGCQGAKCDDLDENSNFPHTCAQGKPVTLSIMPSAVSASEAKAVVDFGPHQGTYKLVPPGEFNRVRLDLCVKSSGNASLMRVLTMTGEQINVDEKDQAVEWQTKNLDEAVTGQVGSLWIRYALYSTMKVQLQAWTVDSKTIVTLAYLFQNNGEWTPDGSKVIYGDLQPKNSFADMPCEAYQTYAKSKVAFETVTLSSTFCGFPGGGWTTGYKLVELAIQDSSTNLPQPVQNKKIIINAKDYEQKGWLKYSWVHHNDGDALELTVKDYNTTYALGSGLHTSNYKVTYPQGAVVQGSFDGHYFLDHKDLSEPNTENTAAYRTELKSVEDYNALKLSQNNLTMVKYTYAFKGFNNQMWYQNTSKYDYHFPFLTKEIPLFANLTYPEYSQLIFNRETPALAAGSVHYGPKLVLPEFSTPGVLGFTVYYEPGQFDMDRATAVYQLLKQTVPWVNGQVAFAFENPADYFRYKQKLADVGIASTVLKQFTGADPE